MGLKTSSEPVQWISGIEGTIPAPSFLHLVHQARSPNKGRKRGQTWPYPFQTECLQEQLCGYMWKETCCSSALKAFIDSTQHRISVESLEKFSFRDTSQCFLERGCTGLVQGSTQTIPLLPSSLWVTPCRALRPHFRPPAVYSFLQDACQALYIWFNRLLLCLSLRSPQFQWSCSGQTPAPALDARKISTFPSDYTLINTQGCKMLPARPAKPPGDNCGTR